MKISIGILSCVICFATPVVFPATAHSQETAKAPAPNPTNSSSLQPNAGEIMLEGIVEKANFEDENKGGKITLQALKFALPDKPIRDIKPLRTKIIFFESEVASSLSSSIPLEVGSRIQVVGVDKGTGTPLTARNIRVISTLLLNLKTTLGKEFAAFERWIGTPVTSANVMDGIHRTYVSPALDEKGVTSILLTSFPRIEGNLKAVTYMQIVFKKDTNLTWQQAADLIGVSPADITTEEYKASQRTRDANGKDVYKSFVGLHLLGLSILGVKMSKSFPSKYAQYGAKTYMGEGFYIDWIAQNPANDGASTIGVALGMANEP